MKIFIFRNDDNLMRVKTGLYKTLMTLDLTKPQQISISDYKEDKTGEQRSWLHVLCGIFGEEAGYTKLQMKRVMIVEVFGTEEVMGVQIAKSSESLNREEYSQLIEQIYIRATDMGIILPSPRMRS
jgi:hypothetical protein